MAVASLDEYRTTKQQSRRPAAPSQAAVIDTVRRFQDYYSRRDEVDAEAELLLWCEHPISLPPDVAKANPPVTHAALLQRQVGLVLGVLSNQRPTLKVGSLLRGQTRQEQAEGIAGFANRYGPLNERQAGTEEGYYLLKTVDQLAFGRGVTAVEPMTRQYATAPRKDSYDTADAYRTAVDRWKRQQGTGTGHSPILLRHVPARSFYHFSSPEMGGMYVSAERRVRTLRDLLADDRYTLNLGKFQDWYDQQSDTNRRAADLVQVALWIVQDREWCSYLLDPTLTDTDPTNDQLSTYAWGMQSLGATLVYQHPNRLGRPNYVITPGLPSPSRDPARRFRGIGYDARWLMRRICEVLTIRGIRTRDNAFPAWLGIRGNTNPNGQEVEPEPMAPEKRKVQLARGNGQITILDNITLQQMLSSGGQDEIPFKEELERHANDLMLPDAILQGAASGYEYNSLRNTVMSRLNPVLKGQEAASLAEFHMTWQWLAVMGESASVSAIEKDGAATYTVDPNEVAWEDLVVESELELERPEDESAQIQKVNEAVQGRVMSMKRARSRYMKIEDSNQEDFQIALEEYMRDPANMDAIKQRAAKEAGLILDQQAAAAQAPPDLAALLQLSAPLLKALAMLAQPGQPGYQAIQAAMQKSSMQPPQNGGGAPGAPPASGAPAAQQPTPQAAPPVMGPPGLSGGRAPGQNVQPGGRRMTGGLA